MSRAFVKEGAPEAPLVIPPRPPLPQGVPNYVTPAGLAALRAEKAGLEAERTALGTEDADAREREWVTGRLKVLVERIATAQIVDPERVSLDRVRFGTAVEVEGADGDRRTFEIVGVDEAAARGGSPQGGAVAFTAPIARAVIGKAVGETGLLKTPRGEEPLTVVSIARADAAPPPDVDSP
ncbi:GreA/GreB family elongation factor [Rubrivirga sp. S365]|uniref:GreA/GreB family elongation factor n=1 Tax=Rubrivirga sp. S365 TaxID=3076080 RepID=UPI0028C54FC5|nr:GreA/GreB family elongation factor [Rubrivirga sp. S365]MDT7857908.1 GreA/GreB family elongation factor [Rubrivirga sp. S365]